MTRVIFIMTFLLVSYPQDIICKEYKNPYSHLWNAIDDHKKNMIIAGMVAGIKSVCIATDDIDCDYALDSLDYEYIKYFFDVAYIGNKHSELSYSFILASIIKYKGDKKLVLLEMKRLNKSIKKH